MKYRFVLTHVVNGIFIGRDEYAAYFSKANYPRAYSAFTFESMEAAVKFAVETLNLADPNLYTIKAIEIKHPYATVVDLIKAGFGDDIGDMLDHYPAPSSSVH